MHLLLATLLLTAIAEAQAESPPRLLHRVFHPSIPIAPFQLRASVHISDNIATIQSAKSFSNDINQFIRDSVHEKNALYLLALAPHGSEDEGTWAVSSVKACHLALAQSDFVTLHLAADGSPFSLDYYLDPVPHDGACPPRKKIASASPSFSNTTVLLKRPSLPPLPELRVPPPLSPQGEPIVPVPEKSFVQKYWMYILIALIALLVGGGGAEEESAPRGAAQ